MGSQVSIRAPVMVVCTKDSRHLGFSSSRMEEMTFTWLEAAQFARLMMLERLYMRNDLVLSTSLDEHSSSRQEPTRANTTPEGVSGPSLSTSSKVNWYTLKPENGRWKYGATSGQISG